MRYAMAYFMMYGLGVWYTAFVLGGNGQTTQIFEAKFGWTKDETVLYNTIISSSGLVGMTIGSFTGGPLIQFGRRKGAIIANIIVMIGAAISMVGTTPFLTISRVLIGVGAGQYNVIFGKLVVENVPESLAVKLAMFHNASICVGFVFVLGMGALLPDQKDYEANKIDELWRIIYIAPIFIGAIEIFFILVVFKHEPIAYCIM